MLESGVCSKVCDAEDFFFGPEIVLHLGELEHTPSVHRKEWELAMILRAMARTGALHEGADALGLACGTERIMFHAARRARSVVATDLYGPAGVGGWEARRLREADVYERCPFEYPRGRLTVRTMDMRRIDAADESYDLVWSACALEHVDTIAELAQVLRETARVLRPGGLHVLTTEWKLAGGFSYFPNCFLFDRPLLERTLSGVKLEPVGPIDLRMSRHPMNAPFWAELDGVKIHMPHVVVRSGGVLHTSICLVFRKASSAGARLDFIEPDPGVGPWLEECYARMTRHLCTPGGRVRLAARNLKDAAFHAARYTYREWRDAHRHDS